ncbi:MAG: hypothetical protein ACRYGI_05655, partial [Janthinobacterium lividum]
MHLHLPTTLDPRQLLRPRRRGIASVNSEIRDGIVPASDGIAQTADHEGGALPGANYRTVALIVACAMFMGKPRCDRPRHGAAHDGAGFSRTCARDEHRAHLLPAGAGRVHP